MQMVAADIMGPFPTTSNENKYILVASDYFTRWVEAYAIPNQEATTVAGKLVNNMFCHFGLPEQLHSDMGTQGSKGNVQHVAYQQDPHDTIPSTR